MPPPSRPDVVTITPQVLRGWPLPEPTGGKESRGVTVIIGGSVEVPGAVLLAAEGALRAGAGKPQVATVARAAPYLSIALPEGLVRGLPETSDGGLDPVGADDVADLVKGAAAVLVGPGMSDPDLTRAFVERLLPAVDCSLVVDALAMAAVTADVECLHHLEGQAVLTPNASELAHTLDLDEDELAKDPAAAALELARRAHAVVALGGATSWVAAPDGRTWREETGGAGLGVSGSGDVRAGITVGLLARGAAPDQAAVWAAHLHGRAGERLAASVGKVGFLAREIPAEVPRVQAEIEL